MTNKEEVWKTVGFLKNKKGYQVFVGTNLERKFNVSNPKPLNEAAKFADIIRNRIAAGTYNLEIPGKN